MQGVKSEKNYPLKCCGEHKVLGNMRNCVIWLMESSASAPLYCKYVTKIFLREFPCHHTSQHRMFAQNLEAWRSFFSRRYFMHLKEMLKLFHLVIKMSKMVPWLTKSWMKPEQAPTSYKYLFFNHIRFGMKNWKLLRFLAKLRLSSLVFAEKKKLSSFILGNISRHDSKVQHHWNKISPEVLLLLLRQAQIVCSRKIESGSQLAYAAV